VGNCGSGVKEAIDDLLDINLKFLPGARDSRDFVLASSVPDEPILDAH
jgi:hypothetical protein